VLLGGLAAGGLIYSQIADDAPTPAKSAPASAPAKPKAKGSK